MSRAAPDRVNRAVRFVWYSSLLLAAVICGVLCAALLRDYRLDELSSQIRCRARLSKIGAALQNYNDAYGTFPPAYLEDESGIPAHSWRVLILPFLGELDLYRRYSFDEPWDGPNNRSLAPCRPAVFACAARDDGGASSGTRFVAVATSESAMRGPHATALADISDAAHTILVIESPDTQVNWLEPRDFDIRQFSLRAPGAHDGRATPAHPDGIWTLFADGGLYLLKYSAHDGDLRLLLSTSASPEAKREAMKCAVGED